MTDTYPMPADGWVCFHCGERFTTPSSARDHFGFYPEASPACTIPLEQFQAELREYRVLEAKFAHLKPQGEAFYTQVSERRRALLRADREATDAGPS